MKHWKRSQTSIVDLDNSSLLHPRPLSNLSVLRSFALRNQSVLSSKKEDKIPVEMPLKDKIKLSPIQKYKRFSK